MADENFDPTNPVAVTVVDAPAPEAPAPEEFVHPGTVNGYDVLDLTVPYNQSHDAIAGGYFRIVCLKDTEVTRDIFTDAPSGPNGEMTDVSKDLVKAAIKQAEADRKSK